MFRQFLPKVTLSVSDRDCLERLAFIAAEDHHPAAPFLISELCRAEIVSDGAVELEPVVGMNTWVDYRLNWGSPIETQKLVYPDDQPMTYPFCRRSASRYLASRLAAKCRTSRVQDG